MEVADDAGGGSASSPVVVAPLQAPPAGDPIQPAVGEACGRAFKNTSGVWKYVRELRPAEVKEDGMNVRCVVKKKWPRLGLAPERVKTSDRPDEVRPSQQGNEDQRRWDKRSAGPPAADPATLPTPAPARSDRLARIRVKKNQLVARPSTIPSASETRTDAGLREFSEYMAEAALTNNSEFDLLEYWRARAVDGLDASGKVVAPARWPHVALVVARVFAGIDTTSCQAERIFSSLKLVVSDLRASLGAEKSEKILFLRLNGHLIPGLGKVVRELESLKGERDGAADAAFIAETTAAASIYCVVGGTDGLIGGVFIAKTTAVAGIAL